MYHGVGADDAPSLGCTTVLVKPRRVVFTPNTITSNKIAITFYSYHGVGTENAFFGMYFNSSAGQASQGGLHPQKLQVDSRESRDTQGAGWHAGLQTTFCELFAKMKMVTA